MKGKISLITILLLICAIIPAVCAYDLLWEGTITNKTANFYRYDNGAYSSNWSIWDTAGVSHIEYNGYGYLSNVSASLTGEFESSICSVIACESGSRYGNVSVSYSYGGRSGANPVSITIDILDFNATGGTFGYLYWLNPNFPATDSRLLEGSTPADDTYQTYLDLFSGVGAGDYQVYSGTAYTPPVPSFNATPETGYPPLEVFFEDTSTPGTNPITSWLWTISYGIEYSATFTDQNFTTTLYDVGTYDVTMNVSDGVGYYEATGQIVVNASPTPTPTPPPYFGDPPVANFWGTPLYKSHAPLTTQFGDLSTNSPSLWVWEFGDGWGSHLENPSHTYASAGNYTVILTATNSAGSDQEVKLDYIIVAAEDYPDPPAGTGYLKGFTYTAGDSFGLLGGTTVSLFNSTYSTTNISTSDGYYKFLNVSAGVYTVNGTKDGYAPSSDYIVQIYDTVVSHQDIALVNLSNTTPSIIITGYVNDAETALPINASFVNLTQGAITFNESTVEDGKYYAAPGFATGTLLELAAGANGYEPYSFNFTPLVAGTINLNITLMPSVPTHSGIGIGGVVREWTYGTPISDATIEAVNGSETLSNTTNTAGFYLFEDLLDDSYYELHGSKEWYENSTTYNASAGEGAVTFTFQDIWMWGSYLHTFFVKDSSSGIGISNVTISSSSGDTNVTNATGYGWLTERSGEFTVSFSAEGYASRDISYVFDTENETHIVDLYSTGDNSISVQSYPKYVTFHVKQGWGESLDDVLVEMTPVSTSTGEWDWLAALLGVDMGEVPLNTNAMNQTTDSLGTATFYIFPTAKYNVTFTKAGYTIPSMILVPRDDHYVIYATSADTTYFRHGEDELSAVNISIVQNHLNESYTYLNLTYLDTSGGTTGGTINIWQKSSIPYGTASLIASWPVTGNSFTNSTGITHVQRVSGIVQANVTHSTFGTILRSYPFQLNSVPVEFLGFGDEIQLLVALGMMLFTAMLAGATHARQIIIVVGMEGVFFQTFGWFSAMVTRGVPNSAIWLAISVMFLYGILANFAERKRRGI